VDASGDVWVADYGNHRIEEFSSSGAFTLAVGWGVKDGKAEAETCTAECRAGISGSGNGQFEGPEGIAVNHSSGNVYVSDFTHGRIEELSSTGTFIASFGSKGAGAGQLNLPEGIAIDSSGNVWVADQDNMRIDEFSSSGTFISAVGWGVKDGKAEAETCAVTCEVGIAGSGNGQLDGAAGIAVSGGNVYVTDYGNRRVDEFSSSGTYISKFGGGGTGNGKFEGVYGIATDPTSGDLYVGDSVEDRIQKFTPSGTFISLFGSEGSGPGQFVSAQGIAVNSAGQIYVVDSSNNRTQEWIPASIESSSPPSYLTAFGSRGAGAGQFEGPARDAVDASGDVWVADYGNHRIEEFSSSGAFTLAVGWGVKDGKAEAETCTAECRAGISGSGNGQFEGPEGIAVNHSSGNVYVSDFTHGRIEELSSTGTFIASFGSKGAGAGQLNLPEGIAIDSSGNVWVADQDNMRIDEFSSSGTFISAVGWGVKDGKAEAETCAVTCEVGIAGSGNGQLDGAAGIAVSGGNVYVTDYGNRRVDEFSSSGTYISKFGGGGTGNGKFEGVYGIATDPTSGDLYVGDSVEDRIQKFTPSGTFISLFGSEGSGPGQFVSAQGIAVNSAGQIYVVDSSNNRTQEWIPASAPINTGPVSISGELIVGQTLAAGTGNWSAIPTPTYAYQWERCNSSGGSCSTIAGATSSTHVLASGDVGFTLRVVVKATNSAGSAESASAATDLLTEVTAQTRVTEYAYDGDGNVESITDANGHKTKYTYNADNSPIKVEAPNKAVTETEYDGAGEVVKQIDGNKHATEYKRNILEEVIEVVDPLGRKTTKEYDLAGNLTKLTDPSNSSGVVAVPSQVGVPYAEYEHLPVTVPVVPVSRRVEPCWSWWR